MKSVSFFITLCFIFTVISFVGSTKRRHKENITAIPSASIIDGNVYEAEIIGVLDDEDDEDDSVDYVKNEFVYSRLSFYYYDE